jgi:hypothetical protein
MQYSTAKGLGRRWDGRGSQRGPGLDFSDPAQWWPGHSAWQGAPGTWKQWLALGASIAFQIATIAGALLAVNDGDRRRQRYRELHQQLGKWDAELEASRTWPSGLRVAGRIERALLAELIEWRSLIRNQKLAKK